MCCFNHYVGLPVKWGRHHPIYDYELKVFDYLEQYDNIEIIKARGLGITELLLRYPVWKAISSNKWSNRICALITGLTINTAKELILRIRNFFYPFGIGFDERDDQTTLNQVRFKAFPAKNPDTLRSYTDFAYVFLDEADFFPKQAQLKLREAVEGYRLKSKPKIIWNSTPGAPDGIMQQLENEIKEGKSLYHLIKLHYEVGLDKIYDPIQLEQEKLQYYFPREYELKYAFGVGDIFTEEQIQRCLDVKYDPSDVCYSCPKVLAADPNYGGSSSKFAFIVLQQIQDKIQVLETMEFERPDPIVVEEYATNTIRKYNLFPSSGQVYGRVMVDRANQLFIRYLKNHIGENPFYDDEPVTREDIKKMRIVPVLFHTFHREMLINMQQLVSRGHVLIDERFDSLLTQMRIAKAGPDYNLLKGGTNPTLDLLDAFRLALFGFNLGII